jgi:Ca-activated chloride channel homolog
MVRLQSQVSRHGCLLLCLSLTLVPSLLSAQRGRAEVREGNRLYEEGRFEDAHERYLEALRENPNSPLIRFNEGNALYQTEEFQSALDAYRQAAETGDASLKSQAWYNLGNALYRQQQLQESAEAYKEALRLDPGDGDAKHNLELALQQMQQQQQQQQQQDQQQDDQQDEEQQQQQQQNQQDEGQDQEQEQQQQQNEQEDQQQQQQEQQQPREMSREEAERLLQAIDEDPSEIDRQRARGGQRVRKRRDW